MRVMKHLYSLDFLITLILLKGKLRGIKEGMGRFQIAKLAAWLSVNSEISSIQEVVFIYKHGPYLLRFEDALADLVRRNILECVTDKEGQTRLCITREGEKWILARLRSQNYNDMTKLTEEIEKYLFTRPSDLIMEIAEKSPLLNPVRKIIGGRELIRIFDWRDFGDKRIHGYHYTLLRSFFRLEEYFDNKWIEAQKKIEDGNLEYKPRMVDYAAIPNVVYTEDLFSSLKEKHTIRYIFSKQDPRSLTVDKFEAKNYIGHLWYVYSTINIIHILARLAPLADEIARVCLTNYEYAIKKEIPYTERRKMREGTLRSDLQTLVKYGILKRVRMGKVYLYYIRAKTIIDSYTSKRYSLLDADETRSLYEREIRPSPANVDLIKRMSSKKIIAVTAEG